LKLESLTIIFDLVTGECQFLLDYIKELISDLDYKDAIDSIMMKEINHDLEKIVKFITDKPQKTSADSVNK